MTAPCGHPNHGQADHACAPFLPPSDVTFTLNELDALHAAIGLGPAWLASERRRDMAADLTISGEVIDGQPHA